MKQVVVWWDYDKQIPIIEWQNEWINEYSKKLEPLKYELLQKAIDKNVSKVT